MIIKGLDEGLRDFSDRLLESLCEEKFVVSTEFFQNETGHKTSN